MGLTILETSAYIRSLRFPSNNSRVLEEPEYELLRDTLNISSAAMNTLDRCSTENQFFSVEKDLAYHVPKEIQNDFFYSLKRKKISKGVSAMLLYYLDFIKSNNLSYNELSNIATATKLEQMFSIMPASISVESIIQNHYCERFKTLEAHRLKVPMGAYYEVYISATDRVAFIVNSIAEMLSEDDISSITVENKNLTCMGKPLSSLGGSLGITRSIYDLRRVL